MSDTSSISDDAEEDEAPVLVNVDRLDQPQTSESLLVRNYGQDSTTAATPTSADVLPPCPVTILSGFLGSGKTTLIQYILQSPEHGKRIAVIENEFSGGSDGPSVETLIARDGANQASLSDLIELPNGCICCTVKDSLVVTLENLLEKRQDLDYILIEASGMANPGPIASLFWLDDALGSRLRLDGVVTLVDAYNIMRQLDETKEAAQQIAFADRILLNKADLVDDAQLESAASTIRGMHTTVPIRTTTYSKVPDLNWILDANCFDVDRAKEVDDVLNQLKQSMTRSSCSDPACRTCKPQNALCVEIPSGLPQHHVHTSAVGTVALVHHGSVDLKRMNGWMASILWPNQDERDSILRARLEQSHDVLLNETRQEETMQIFRVKGILSVRFPPNEAEAEDRNYVNDEGVDIRRYIVQAVHDLWEIHPASADLNWDQPLPGESELPNRTCKLLVIGRCLRESNLKSGFASCFV